MSGNNNDQQFKKFDCIVSPCSASAVYNNLVIKSSRKKLESATIIHRDLVCIVPSKVSASDKVISIRCSRYTPERNIHITQVSWCDLGPESLIIITSSAGVYVVNEYAECVFSHPCSDVAGRSDSNDTHFARGIATFSSGYFCTGNSSGCIRMFGQSDLSGEITFIDRKHNHNFPICDLSAYGSYMVSIDEQGLMMLWRLEGEELIHKTTVNTNNDCTGVKLNYDSIITFYASGHIRHFSLCTEPFVSLVLTAEIAAHTRAITAFDVSVNNKYLLTASEDSFVKVWLLYEDRNTLMIKHFYTVPMKDNMLMGVRFITPGGNKFCATSYDSNIISCFSNSLE